jgi:hypothetical protein
MWPELAGFGRTKQIASLVLAVNINRRHLTKGQRAMAIAKLYPNPATLKRKGSSVLEDQAIAGRVSEARTVLRWLPQIADHVLAGTKPLNEAYAEAQRLKEQADAEPPRLARLRGFCGDVARFDYLAIFRIHGCGRQCRADREPAPQGVHLPAKTDDQPGGVSAPARRWLR